MGFACVAGALLGFLSTSASAFDFQDVAQRARRLADAPYKKADADLPPELRNLNYENYHQIRYKPERMLWRNDKLPFEVDFFPPGWHFDQPVRINEVTAQGVREIRFDQDAFDFGATKVDPGKLHGLGFAGFRVRYPVNSAAHKDEVLTFLGASYFRALGKGQHYGLDWRLTPHWVQARSFRASWNSGYCGRKRRINSWSSTACSIRRVLPAPTVSC